MQEEPVRVNVHVKWGTQKFENLPFELTSKLPKFRQLLFELSSVPTEKQKIIFKGQTLKDDSNLLNLKISEGDTIMLMGQADKDAIKIPATKVVFIEDLTPEERARHLKENAGIVLPIGLVNLGNTCYLNSSIQCLKRVDEFRKHVTEGAQTANQQLYNATSKLFGQLERKGEAFKPVEFVQTFMNTFPMFAEREQQGGAFKQQDADECFQNILTVIEPLCKYVNQQGEERNLIKDLFEVKMEITFKNAELPDEPESKTSESQKKFMCIIDNEFNPVNTLVEGIRVSLQGTVEKKSPIDNLNHIYTKTQRIVKLPSYLLVQMVRFIWKQGTEGKEGVKAKILRQVSFPKILDIHEFCTEQLKANLQPGRDFEKKQLLDNVKLDQDRLEQFKKDLEAKVVDPFYPKGQMIPDDTREIYKKFKEKQKEEELKNHDDSLYREHGQGLETGCYQVVGVLTHKGRYADSGHYVAWIHHSGDHWVCFDDDKVSEVTTEQILDLRGGGDWHMGYYLLYRKLEIQ